MATPNFVMIVDHSHPVKLLLNNSVSLSPSNVYHIEEPRKIANLNRNSIWQKNVAQNCDLVNTVAIKSVI